MITSCIFFSGFYNEQRFNCEKCFKSYKHDHSLRRHLKFECGKPPSFQCEYCHFQTHRKHNLQRHIMLLHSVIPNQIALNSFLDEFTL